ncbi:MAG: putative response regulatory protein [Firmicutes bacterium ADurb.Bin419]|nr:MAG: putative response regulatory protein [Firmicutes bacterium ADurb.Bin419]
MFSVMIVDDDPLICEWLTTQINWNQLGFEVGYIANNGIDALHKLNEYNPDIIISDISMPKMGGIELLNSIKEYDKRSQVVFLSDESDYPHVKQGMLLGAFGYILKPIDENSLLELMKKVFEDLMAKKQEEEKKQKIKEKIELFRERVLYDILRGKEYLLQKFDDIVDEYDVNLHKGAVQVAIVEIGNFDANSKELVKSGKFDELTEKVRNRILELADDFGGISCVIGDMDIGILSVIIQPLSEIQLNDFEEISYSFFSKLLEKIKQEIDVRVTIGVGNIQQQVNEISLSYMGAKAALRHKYIIGGNRVIHIKEFDFEEKQKILYPAEREKLLTEYIMSADEKALQLVNNLFDEISLGSQGVLKRIAFAANQLVYNISRCIDSQYGYIKKLYDFSKFTDIDFTTFNSEEEIKKYFIHTVNDLTEVVKKYKPGHGNPIIVKACDYVLQHIDEDITLMTISDKLNLSKNYFCSLFKQETGYNFLEYVTTVKMEWAKRLLQDGNCKTYEVSDMLGYRESSYFSRLFRKYTKHSPAEYKKMFKNDVKEINE